MKPILGFLLIICLVGCGKDSPTGASEEITKGPEGQTLEVYHGENEDGDKIEYQFYRSGKVYLLRLELTVVSYPTAAGFGVFTATWSKRFS